jgi:putative ABC transport system permease protein
MLRVALRGLAERRGRTLSTLLAIVLGVAFIAGTYVFTDTIDRSFAGIIGDANAGVDVRVTPAERELEGAQPPTLPAGIVERLRGVEGAEEVAGTLEVPVSLVDARGEDVAGSLGASAVSATADRFDTFTYDGRPPRTAGEVAVDAGTAERAGLRLGDTVRVAGEAPARAYRLVGIGRLGDAGALGGISLAVLTLGEVQRVGELPGRLSEVSLAAAPGTSAEELRERVRALAGGGTEVRTGEEATAAASRDIEEELGFLTTLLLVFGFVSLVVGSFSIFNTFSITVAQRMRQFALLRTVGASRGQVLRVVVAEGAALGLVGSLLGLVAGIALAPALNGLFDAVGLDLPSTGLVVAPRTVAVALLVGVLTTVLASLVPALRATRVPPVAALREGAVGAPAARTRRRTAAGAVTIALGVALLCAGLFAGGGTTTVLTAMLLGALVVFVGVALLAPLLVGPVAALAGAPVERVGGVAGRLARGNAVRNPARTASTAAALMVGVSLVTLVTMLAAGIKASFSGAFEEAVTADLVLQGEQGAVPGAVRERIAGVPGVDQASPLPSSPAKLVDGGDEVRVLGLDPRTAPAVLSIPWVEGSDATLARLGSGGVLLDEQWAQERDLRVGSALALRTPAGETLRLRVRGVYDDRGGLLGPIAVAEPVVREAFGAREDDAVLVAAGDPAAVQRAVNETLAREFPTLRVQTREEFIDEAVGQVDRLLVLFYALLSLAVLIALFGIANTLALSIHERTRELGLLRAIGASKRQVRRIVRGEALITALIGALIGIAVGIAFAALLAVPLAEEGFVLTLPVGTLLGVVVAAALLGVLAALRPARRASRIDVLRALQYE